MEDQFTFTIKDEYVTITPLGELSDCQENRDFEQNEIIPRLRSYAHVCRCQTRNMVRRYATTNRTPVTHGRNTMSVVRQEDIDTLRFGVVTTVADGKYSGVATIVVQCSVCKRLEFYGQLPAALNMFAIGLDEFYSGSSVKIVRPATPDDDGMEFEDLDTGEVSKVPDSLKPLLGGK